MGSLLANFSCVRSQPARGLLYAFPNVTSMTFGVARTLQFHSAPLRLTLCFFLRRHLFMHINSGNGRIMALFGGCYGGRRGLQVKVLREQ